MKPFRVVPSLSCVASPSLLSDLNPQNQSTEESAHRMAFPSPSRKASAARPLRKGILSDSLKPCRKTVFLHPAVASSMASAASGNK